MPVAVLRHAAGQRLVRLEPQDAEEPGNQDDESLAQGNCTEVERACGRRAGPRTGLASTADAPLMYPLVNVRGCYTIRIVDRP